MHTRNGLYGSFIRNIIGKTCNPEVWTSKPVCFYTANLMFPYDMLCLICAFHMISQSKSRGPQPSEFDRILGERRRYRIDWYQHVSIIRTISIGESSFSWQTLDLSIKTTEWLKKLILKTMPRVLVY